MKSLKISRLGFFVVGGSPLVACNKSEPTGEATSAASGPAEPAAPKIVKLAFVTNNASEFWKIAAGRRPASTRQESKVQVDVKMPPNGTTAEQNQILENLASQGYDAIAVSAIAPERPGAGARQGRREDASSSPSTRTRRSRSACSTSAPTTSRPARRSAREIVKLLPNGGKMAVFVGTLSADNATQRCKGIEDAIAGKKIEIVDKREDNTDRAKARSNVEDIVNAHRDLNLVAGLWSYNGPAIAAALEALGKKGKVLAAVFDEDDGTLDGHRRAAPSRCTVVQKPFEFGYLSSKWMHELATKRRGDGRDPADQGHRHRRRGHRQGQRRRFPREARGDEEVGRRPIAGRATRRLASQTPTS